MTTILGIVITAACFLAAILNLASEHHFRNLITGTATVIALCFGVLFYGYGFSWVYGLTPTAILRAVLAVSRMFVGVNDLGSIQQAPLMQYDAVIAIFWIVHFLAFYAMASATIAAVGNKVMRRIRMVLLRRGTLVLIYGVNAHSVDYGKRRAGEKYCSVLFVDGGCSADLEASIRAAGVLVDKSPDALAPGKAFLRRIGLKAGKRRLEAAMMHADGLKNLSYAQALLDALAQAGIKPQQTSLLIQGVEEDQAAALSVYNGQTGYGSVLAFDEYELAARLMIHRLPPCSVIHFDENAKAVEDFHAVIVGFGRMGQAALDQLVMNGQFFGSDFRVDVFDAGACSGMLQAREVSRQYNICFHETGSHSRAFYDFLHENADKIRYIVLSTGDAQENREMELELRKWFRSRGPMPAMVQCTTDGLMCTNAEQYDFQYQSIYQSDVLDLNRIDRMAMAIQHVYRAGPSAQEDWQACDYFSRMSCRASADFSSAFLRAAGITTEDVLADRWSPEGEKLENMARTEHLRWCAFHYVMGFSTMSREQFDARAAQYQEEIRTNGSSALRIGKDLLGRRHACLIPWEELDELSARENEVTGGRVDYKAMDRNNVLVLPEILRTIFHDEEDA